MGWQWRYANGAAQPLAIRIGRAIRKPDWEFPANTGSLCINGAADGPHANIAKQSVTPTALRRAFHAGPKTSQGFNHVVRHLAMRMGIGFSKIKGDSKIAATRPAIRTRARIAIGRIDMEAPIGLNGNDLPNFSLGHGCQVYCDIHPGRPFL